MEKEIIISDQIFHNWKQNDCTKAVIKVIDDIISRQERVIANYVVSAAEININSLYQMRGVANLAKELAQIIQEKDTLEIAMQGVENENS